PVNEANIAITSWIDALSQLMPVIRGSCDCLAGAADLLSATGIIAGAVFSTGWGAAGCSAARLLGCSATGFPTTGFSTTGFSATGFSGTGFSAAGCGFGASTVGAACC